MEGRDEPYRRPPSGPKLGFDENEQKEFSRAMKQGLLVQTPLQVLLETLFTRLQTQAGLFSELARKVERLESRDIGGHELLHRLQLCEGKLSNMLVSKLSPFNQQQVLNRLDELERQGELQRRRAEEEAEEVELQGAEAQERAQSPSKTYGLAGMDARMAAVEEKLNGVYNLSGKMIAVDHMAAELGIQVPDLEYNPGMTAEDFLLPTKAPALALHTPPTAAASSTTAPTTSAQAAPSPLPPPSTSTPAAQAPAGAASSLPSASQPPCSPPLSPRLRPKALQLLQEHSVGALDPGHGSPFGGGRTTELKLQITEVAAANEALKATVESLRQEVHHSRSELAQRQSHLVNRVESLESCTQQLKQQVAEDMATFKSSAKKDPEVSFADFSLLQSQVAVAARDMQGTREAVLGLKEQEVKALGSAVAEVKEGLRKADGPREMDTLFHQRLSAMECKYNDVRAQVQQAAAEALSSAAKVTDLEELARELDNKASQLDIRQLAQQQQTLAQSVNGMAEWLSVRPETSDGAKGTGSSATKFKCLTCDREMRTQAVPNGNPALKGMSLPKLEGMHPQPSPIPLGPGLNSGRAKIPPISMSQDLGSMPEERATLDLTVGSPVRTAPPAAAAGSNAAAAAMKLPPGPRVPVFI